MATGLFKWKRKNIYTLIDVGGFLSDIDGFCKRLEHDYGMRVSEFVAFNGESLFVFWISAITSKPMQIFIGIPKSKDTIKLVLGHKDSLQRQFIHDGYMLSDEFFRELQRKALKEESRM